MKANSMDPEFELTEIDGKKFWLHNESGLLMHFVAGGADDGDGGDDGDDGDDNDGDDGDDDGDKKSKSSGKGLSTAEMQRIAAKEKREGIKKGRTDLLKELGIENADELKELLKNHRESQDSKKTDADKASEAAATAKAEAEEARREAKVDRLNAKAERQLIVAGVPDKMLARALRNLDLDVDDDPDLEAIKEEIGKLKKEMPSLFASKDKEDDDDDDEDSSADSTPPKGPKSKGKKDAHSAAAEMLAKRHPKAN